jgi:hypothetical protein
MYLVEVAVIKNPDCRAEGVSNGTSSPQLDCPSKTPSELFAHDGFLVSWVFSFSWTRVDDVEYDRVQVVEGTFTSTAPLLVAPLANALKIRLWQKLSTAWPRFHRVGRNAHSPPGLKSPTIARLQDA